MGNEQIQILNFLDVQLEKINKVYFFLHQTQIESSKNTKAVLIDTAVTGKIKVPGV